MRRLGDDMSGGLRFDLGKLARICVGMLWISVASELVYGAQTLRLLGFLSDIDSGALQGPELMLAADSIDQTSTVVSIVYLGIFVATVIFSSVWIYRSSWNARQIQPSEKRITPGWAIGWYFVPFLSLWKPYQAAVQCLNSSEDPQGAIDRSAPGFFQAWWFLWVVSSVGGNLSFRLSNKAVSADDIRSVALLDLGLAPLSIITTLLFIRVIKTITQAQQGRYPAQAIEETFA
jgi:hypothetical protein